VSNDTRTRNVTWRSRIHGIVQSLLRDDTLVYVYNKQCVHKYIFMYLCTHMIYTYTYRCTHINYTYGAMQEELSTVTQRRSSLIDLHAPMVANRLNHAGAVAMLLRPVVSRAHRVGHARARYIGEVHEAKARIDSDVLYHNDKRDDTCVPTITARRCRRRHRRRHRVGRRRHFAVMSSRPDGSTSDPRLSQPRSEL